MRAGLGQSKATDGAATHVRHREVTPDFLFEPDGAGGAAPVRLKFKQTFG
jgi:hypothetical protein